MIHFQTSTGASDPGAFHRVIFSPRPGTSRGAREIERQLLYGYYCPYCRNPVLFAFLTPEKLALRKYEESWVVNNSAQLRRVIPADSNDRETAYQSDWTPIPGRSMGLQRVRMKNHVLPEDVIGKKDAAHQPGTRCCPFVGVFSLRQDLLIRDTILMGGFAARELARYNLPSWEQFEEIVRQDARHFLRYGIGPHPLIMVRADWIDDQKGVPYWREVLLPFKKPKPTAEEPERAIGEKVPVQAEDVDSVPTQTLGDNSTNDEEFDPEDNQYDDEEEEFDGEEEDDEQDS